MAAPKAPVLELVIPAALVDEFGDVVALRDAFAPTERLHRKLSEQLKLLVLDQDPNAEFLIRGERFTLRISARSLERKVDVPAARKLLGAKTFLEVATVTMSALADWLLKPQIEAITISSQTGPRSFNPIPIADVKT